MANKKRTIEYTCEGQTIDLFKANYSDSNLPKKGQTFSTQRVVGGAIRSKVYLVEQVYVTDRKVQCDCSFLNFDA